MINTTHAFCSKLEKLKFNVMSKDNSHISNGKKKWRKKKSSKAEVNKNAWMNEWINVKSIIFKAPKSARIKQKVHSIRWKARGVNGRAKLGMFK